MLEDPLVAMPLGKVDFDIKTYGPSLTTPIPAESKDRFFPLFSNYTYHLLADEASIRESTFSVLKEFRDDGVVYLELRTTPRAIPESEISKDDYIGIILESIRDFGDSLSACLILSVDRRNTATEAIEVVDLAIKHQDDGVAGIDLCGDPSKGDVSVS
jgi:adenosine deaminase